MEEIIRFVTLAQTGRFTDHRSARAVWISRKTGYKHLERYPAELEWLPKDLSEEFSAVANRLLPIPILAELPSEWTVNCEGVDWFVRHLAQSLKEPPHRDWRNHD